MTAKEYMEQMHNALGSKLLQDNLYGNKDGHLRLAREIGYALPDFTEKEQEQILKASYSSIYVRACFLKPILNAKEWITEMRIGFNKERARRTY